MSSSLKTFAVYTKPGRATSLESAIFVPQGFSWGAWVLGALWALYHRIWWLAALYVILAFGIRWFLPTEHFAEEAYALIFLGISTFLAFQFYDWMEETLQRNGYILLGVVSGLSLEHAQQRFLDSYLHS